MSIKEAFALLQIEKTEDRRKIKLAYRKLLPLYNPEEDEEAFLNFRQAYEVAMQYAKNSKNLDNHGETIIKKVEEEQSALTDDTFVIKEQDKGNEEEGTEEDRELEYIKKEIEKIYASPETRNDLKVWDALLDNDLFLHLEYQYKGRIEILSSLFHKYMLKSSTIKHIFDVLKLQEYATEQWNRFPKECMDFLFDKLRDNLGYLDFIYEDIANRAGYSDIRDLSEIFTLVTGGEWKDNRQIVAEKISEVFGTDRTMSLVEQAETLVKKYPKGFFVKILALHIYENEEEQTAEKSKKMQKIEQKIWEDFLDIYVKDERFIFWNNEYINSAYFHNDNMEIFKYSKAGEYFLVKKYIDKELENGKEIPLSKETDRFLVRAHLDSMEAKDEKQRSKEVILWHKVDSTLEKVLQTDPKEKTALLLKMQAGAKLYDVDTVKACYEEASELMKDNPYVYIFMVKAYLSIDDTESAKTVFERAEKQHVTSFALEILHLHFRKSYDFKDNYDLTEAMEEGKALLTRMLQQRVGGELLAEMYYAMAYLVYSDSRYDMVEYYLEEAIALWKKPKYYFLAAMDAISDRKNDYVYAKTLFEQVYRVKEWWDDGESLNPRFAGEKGYDGSIWLNSNDATDLYNLYVKLGYCSEKTKSYQEAIKCYKNALLIMPDKVKVAIGFERIATMLIRKKGMQGKELVEQAMAELTPDTLELLPCKWLQAEFAFDKGEEELALKIVKEIEKTKLTDDFVDSQLRDYLHFADHLRVKIYMKREKYLIAKKYLGSLLESMKNHKNRGMAENKKRIRQIYRDVEAWYKELGEPEEADAVKKELGTLR